MVPSLLSTVNGSSHRWISDLQPFWTIMIILSVIWFLALNPLCMVIFKGQTIGKKIMGIRVVSHDGSRAGFLQIIVREWIGKYLINSLFSATSITFAAVLPSIGSLVWASLSKERMTIHDAIAQTRVINWEKR
jgi:uncharacterized RDD family membrane protein YckC